jgi:hypothetical protein
MWIAVYSNMYIGTAINSYSSGITPYTLFILFTFCGYCFHWIAMGKKYVAQQNRS